MYWSPDSDGIVLFDHIRQEVVVATIQGSERQVSSGYQVAASRCSAGVKLESSTPAGAGCWTKNSDSLCRCSRLSPEVDGIPVAADAR